MQVQGLPQGSNARRVFCGPLRVTRRLAPVQIDPAVMAAFRAREPRVVSGLPAERPWLIEARRARGLRLVDVGRALGVAAPCVWRLEHCLRHKTTERRAQLLQQLLGLSDEQRAELTTALVTRWA